MLSVIIPSYNEAGNIPKTASVISKLLDKENIDYEIIFINDGSTDNSWELIKALSQSDEHIFGIDFSRNFGKESAIFAGLKASKGDCCVLMDCDLQFPPSVMIEMYNIWLNNDIDIVEGRKRSRGKESIIYRGFSKLFYKLIGSSSGLDMESSSDFKLLDRSVVDSLNEMPERLTFFRAMSSWVGYKTETIYFDVAEREIGESKWSTAALVKFAINNITSFTSAPLQLVTVFGVITFLVSVILGVHTLVMKLLDRSAEGFSTVIILQLLTSSIIMFSLGVIGYYISKIYEEIKHRPRYIVRDIAKKDLDKNSLNNKGKIRQ